MSTVITERPIKAAHRPWTDNWFVHPLFLHLLSVVILFGAWEYAGLMPISPAFPAFAATFAAFVEMLGDGTLLTAFWITLQPLALGPLTSGLLGVTAGIAMASIA